MEQNLLFSALAAKYEAEVKHGLATLNIYFTNSVGIGEHPQQLEEMDKLVGKIADAEGKLEQLKAFFNEDGSVKKNVDVLNVFKKG